MILLINNKFQSMNGVSYSARDLLISLASSGKKVAVLSSDDIKSEAAINRFENIEWYNISIITKFLRILFPSKVNRYYFNNLLTFLKNILRIGKTNKKIDFNSVKMIFVNGIDNHHYFSDLSYENRPHIKHVLIVRETPNYFSSTKINWAKNSFNKYDICMFNSNYCLNEWSKTGVLKNKECFVFNNCVNSDSITTVLKSSKEEIKKRLGFSSGDFNVSIISSIQKRKGQDLVISIMDEFVEMFPNLKLYLIGPVFNKNESDVIFRMIRTENNGNRIHYLGPKRNALEYIYASDLIIQPSRAETFGRVVIEAFALHTPVLASDTGGLSELIKDGETGYLFKSECRESLVESLKRVKSSDDIKRIVKNSNAYLLGNFLIDNQVKTFNNIIDRYYDK